MNCTNILVNQLTFNERSYRMFIQKSISTPPSGDHVNQQLHETNKSACRASDEKWKHTYTKWIAANSTLNLRFLIFYSIGRLAGRYLAGSPVSPWWLLKAIEALSKAFAILVRITTTQRITHTHTLTHQLVHKWCHKHPGRWYYTFFCCTCILLLYAVGSHC